MTKQTQNLVSQMPETKTTANFLLIINHTDVNYTNKCAFSFSFFTSKNSFVKSQKVTSLKAF